MTKINKRKRQTEHQRNYRADKLKQGYKRLDIYIPPDLWAKLRLRLGHYQPGIALVKLLAEIELDD